MSIGALDALEEVCASVTPQTERRGLPLRFDVIRALLKVVKTARAVTQNTYDAVAVRYESTGDGMDGVTYAIEVRQWDLDELTLALAELDKVMEK